MPKPQRCVPQLYSAQELAQRFDVSTKTVSRWIQSGELRAHHLGRQIRVTEEDALTFIAARRR